MTTPTNPQHLRDAATEQVSRAIARDRNQVLAAAEPALRGVSGEVTVDRMRQVAGIVAGMLILFVAFFSWDTWRSEKAQVFEYLQRTAEVEGRALEVYFQRYERVLQALREDIFDAGGNPQPHALVHAELQKTLRREPDWSAMTIRTADGKMVQGSRAPSPNSKSGGVRSSSSDWNHTMDELRRGANLAIGRGVTGSLTNQFVVPLRYAVRDTQGKLVHVITTAIPLSRPISFWEGVQFPPGGGVAVVLLQDAAYAIARLPLPAAEKSKDVYGVPRSGGPAEAVLHGAIMPAGTYEAKASFTDSRTLFGYARFKQYPLMFVIQSPVSLVWERWWVQVRYLYLAMLLLVSVGFIVFRWSVKREQELMLKQTTADIKLRASEAFFRAMFEQAGVGIGIREVDSARFVKVNQKLADLTGYTSDELLAIRSQDLLPKPVMNRGSVTRRIVAGEIDSHTIEQVYCKKDGSEFWANRSISAIRRQDGTAEYMVFMLTDVSARRRAELDAVRRSQRLTTAEALAHLGSWEWDLTTGRSIWSDEMYRIFGYEPQSVAVNEELRYSRIHAADRERISAAASHAAREGTPFSAQYRVVRPDGSERHVSSEGHAEKDEQGRLLRISGYALDITERLRIQSALESSLKEKDTLLREIHHRVKNNLQIVSSLLYFQSKKVRHADDLQVFSEGRDRLRSMMLIHEKLYQSQTLSEIEFGDYLNALAHQVGQTYLKTPQQVRVNVQADDTRLPIDVALPCGMLVNELLSNAFKYAFADGRAGELAVTVGSAGGHMNITVSDNGVGLPQFVDPDQPQSFGLQLVRNLADQLDAQIRWRSGAGVTVEVSVPVRTRAQASEQKVA